MRANSDGKGSGSMDWNSFIQSKYLRGGLCALLIAANLLGLWLPGTGLKEAQLPGGVQHMDKAIPDGCPVGCAVLRVALNAGDPDILPKSGKKLGLQRVNARTQFHRNSSNHTISR